MHGTQRYQEERDKGSAAAEDETADGSWEMGVFNSVAHERRSRRQEGGENGEHDRECMEPTVLERNLKKDQQLQRIRSLLRSWEMGGCSTHEEDKRRRRRRRREGAENGEHDRMHGTHSPGEELEEGSAAAEDQIAVEELGVGVCSKTSGEKKKNMTGNAWNAASLKGT